MNGIGDTGPVGPLQPGGERRRIDGARDGDVPRGTPPFLAAGQDPALRAAASGAEIRAEARTAAARGLAGAELAAATVAGALERMFGSGLPQRFSESVARDLGQDPAVQALVQRLARGEATTP